MKIVDYGLSICLSFLLFIVVHFSAVLSGLYLPRALMAGLSIGWIIMTLLFYLLLKGRVLSWLYILINSIIVGVMIAWYYQRMNLPIYDFGNMLVLLAGALAINLAGLHIMDYKKNAHILFSIVASIVLIYAAYQGGYLGIAEWNMVAIIAMIILAFNIACMRYPGDDGEHEFLAIAKMSSMLMCGLVFYCIAVAVTEGESLETLDEMVGGIRGKRST